MLNHPLYLSTPCSHVKWGRLGKHSKNTTQGYIQTEKSVYSTKVYSLINIQNKDDFLFFQTDPLHCSTVSCLDPGSSNN